jgi:hypothetical protein
MATMHDRARGASFLPSRMRASLLLAVSLLSGCDLFSADVEDRTLADFPVEQSSLLEHLNFLAADSLYGREAGTTYELQAAEYLRDEFAGFGLEPGIAGFLQTFVLDAPEQETGGAAPDKADQVVSQNVLATLPGRGALAGEWVVLGAHYDHLGFEMSSDSVVVYNGADDNASGTALLLEAARILSDFTALETGADRRSIMFQAYGAEEIGLVGSFYFTSNPTISADNIVAMINLDMVGRLREELVVRGISTRASLVTMLADLNEGRLILAFPGGTPDRSDQFPFYLEGIPVLHFFTGTHAQYHTPLDDVWRLNLDGMQEIGRLVVGLLWELASRPTLVLSAPGGPQ